MDPCPERSKERMNKQTNERGSSIKLGEDNMGVHKKVENHCYTAICIMVSLDSEHNVL